MEHIQGEYIYVRRTIDGVSGWVPLNTITLHEAQEAFAPDQSWVGARDGFFLPLGKGDAVVITHRYTGNWSGWAYGYKWGGLVDCLGCFPESYVRAMLSLCFAL